MHLQDKRHPSGVNFPQPRIRLRRERLKKASKKAPTCVAHHKLDRKKRDIGGNFEAAYAGGDYYILVYPKSALYVQRVPKNDFKMIYL